MQHMATNLINRVASPMRLIEENYDLGKEEMDRKRKKMIESQHSRSPFLIGSIDEINTKISKLDKKLHCYTDLVIDSQASDELPTYVKPPSAKQREIYQKKEREAKEVNQFAGIYAIKSSFIPGTSERVKNISKISMNPSRQNMKSDSGKPKFVELHQYPGYDPSELTPLPNGVSATQILSKVANAQPKLKNKPQYLPEFERLFYSQMSQAILQDTFWWYFLEKYQRTSHYQIKLFNRVAHNYIKLLTYANHPRYRETFLKDYPSLLAQGVYTCFCESFPDSYRQFGEHFKEDLVNFVFEWITGLRPQPRIWLKWNLSRLEPPHIKMREEIMNQAKNADKKRAIHRKASSLINFDMVETGTTYSQTTGSQSTLNQISSMSSYGSSKTGRRKSVMNRRGSKFAGTKISSSTEIDIQKVAEAQECKEDNVAANKDSGNTKGTNNSISNKKKSRQEIMRDDAVDPLTPIREFEENEDINIMNTQGKTSRTSNEHVKSYISLMRSQKKTEKESHPIGRGPDFTRGAFNIYGQSPLVAHFLRMRRLETDAGINFRVQRTQMVNLPPLDTPTYRDLMRDSYKHVQQIEKKYESFAKKEKKHKAAFIKKLKEDQKEYKKREAALLNKPHEVKRLSDLLMLEMTKDQDSITAGANAAIEAALLSAV